MREAPVSFFVDASADKNDALEWTSFLLVVTVWLFGSDAVGALLLCDHILGVNVKLCRCAFFFFFFRHGRGLRRVGERGGEVDEESRARDGLEHRESNVRT